MEEVWKEYETQKLGDYILDIAAGPFGSNLKVECFVPSGFPIIDGANLRGFKVTDNVTKFVTEEKARSLYRSIAKRNDVVVTISGNVGQISYIPNNSKYKEYLVSQRQFRATFDTTKVYVPYLIYYFHTIEGQHKILSFANQTGVPALAQPLKNFKNIDVQLPPLSKQKQIASILSSIDDKIECNQRINDNLPWVLWMTHLILLLFKRKNDNLEQQAQALFKSWFVDFEPFKNGEFVESEIGMIPKGWRVVSLNDACIKITDGSHYSPKDNPLGTIPMLSVKDMLHNGFDYSSCKMIDEDEYEKMRANDCVPLKNDILVAKDGSYLKEIFICSESAKQAILSSIAMFRCNKNVIFPEILLQLLRLPKVRKDVGDNYVSGSALPRIVLKDFKKFRFVIAPIDIQNEIAGTLQSINMQIYKNEQESRRLAQLRDTLLPRLMSGKLKVNEL